MVDWAFKINYLSILSRCGTQIKTMPHFVFLIINGYVQCLLCLFLSNTTRLKVIWKDNDIARSTQDQADAGACHVCTGVGTADMDSYS